MSHSAGDRPQPVIVAEPPLLALGRAVRLAAVAGAALGALESLRHVAGGAVREASWVPALLATGVVGHGLAAALLALPATLLALLLWRAPSFRAALPSSCAGLGAAAGVAAFAFAVHVEGHFLLPLALAGTLVCLALRELLAWWSWPVRLAPWAALLVLALLGHGVALLATGKAAPPAPARTASIAGSTAAAGTAPASSPTTAPRNVVLVTIDTLRADHLGCYGAADASTPVLDRLAREGVLFEQATAQANVTGPSHTSMLTGLYPRQHGAHSNGAHVSNAVRTLPDVLSERLGMRTGAFISGFTLVDQASGLGERFDYYDDQLLAWPWMPEAALRMRLVRAVHRRLERHGYQLNRADRPAGETVGRALRWVDSGDLSRAFFLWVHFYDPHAPYDPPGDFERLHAPDFDRQEEFDWYRLSTTEREALTSDPELVAHMRARYRGEISYADQQLGRLLEGLERRKTLDDALVIVTSDHGEGLGSHDYWFDHGTFLYDEELHVPLIARFPRGQHAGARVREQVRLMDIAPTTLEWLGIPEALQTSAASLMPLVAASAPDGSGHPSFASVELGAEHDGFPLAGERLALRKEGKKLIWTSAYWLDTLRIPERFEFYDLVKDPGELEDLAAQGPPDDPVFQDLRKDIDLFREAHRNLRGRELDASTLEQFKKLGY